MKHNQKIGLFGERLAREYLKKKGYEIIGSNIRAGRKEIDIVAAKNRNLVFVEVKTRVSSKFGEAEDSVFGEKTKNLRQAASFYLRQIGKKPKYDDVRLDLIAININRAAKSAKIKHYENIA